MKRTLLFITLFMSTLCINAQNTYHGSFTIIKNETSYSTDFIINSIQKSNLEPYRLKNSSIIIHFENGFDIELNSANELLIQGKIGNTDSYLEDKSKLANKTFSLAETGYVMIGVQNQIHIKSVKK